MKVTSILCVVFLLSGRLGAQERIRGVSQPGRLGEPIGSEEITPVESDGIVCSVHFDEPSGNGVLEKDESGLVTIKVENRTREDIEPELHIYVHSTWQPKPILRKKLLRSIRPGGEETYISKILWDERFPSGVITYDVKAVDPGLGLASSSVSVRFDMLGTGDGGGEAGNESIFVDVDDVIPRVLTSNAEGVAVIVGNRDYISADVPPVEYAVRDAETVREYLIRMMGFQEENIIFIPNAKKVDFERVFGTKDVFQGKLYNWVKPDVSDVFVYYSGHGAPDPSSNQGYFMPTNSDPSYIRIDGYGLDVFYKNLQKLPARSVTVVLDACFSGRSHQGMLVKNASPMYIDVDMPLKGKPFDLFTSASKDQIASWYQKGNHSLFTYYFLRALRGEADTNRDRKITLEEMAAFLGEHVPYMARRLYGREQTPLVHGNKDRVMITY